MLNSTASFTPTEVRIGNFAFCLPGAMYQTKAFEYINVIQLSFVIITTLQKKKMRPKVAQLLCV